MTINGPATRLRQLLDAAGRVRVPLSTIQEMWTVAAPELVGSPDQLRDLARAVESLAEAGAVALPARQSWDRSTRPALPKFLVVDSNRAPSALKTWRTFPWCAELGWVSSLSKLNAAQHAQLVALNTWLSKRTDDTVPMRVRSAEIFGDEKAIDRLIATGLFGEDRLTLDLLGCRRYPPPLTVTRAGEGPDVLVVENSDAYWVALEALRNIDSGIGRVAFGSGRGFVQSVYALAEQPDSIEQLWYWGDLDPDGIAIPAHAAKVATTIGLPPLAPARRLWDAMAAQTGTDTGLVNWIGSDESWLGPELWSETEPIRAAHARVAQERLSPNVVRNALAAGEVQLPGGPPLG